MWYSRQTRAAVRRKFAAAVVRIAALSLAGLVLGCSAIARATPTEEATPTESVLVVVVTETPPPTPEATETSEATITPLVTFTPFGTPKTSTPTATRTPPKALTALPVLRRATATATAPTPTPTNTAVPNKYAAPTGIDPVGSGLHDGAAITFHAYSIGALQPNECYLLNAEFIGPNGVPASGDNWLLMDTCGSNSSQGSRIYFFITWHFGTDPNFALMLQLAKSNLPAQQYTFRWWLTVVQDNGLGPDGVHHNVVDLSPPGAPLDNPFYP